MSSQRSGVLNLGVEGQMILGAFFAFYVAKITGNLWLGVLAAMGVGALMGLAMAIVTIELHATQESAGLASTFWCGNEQLTLSNLDRHCRNCERFSRIAIPLLSKIPIFGDIFFNQNILVYLAF